METLLSSHTPSPLLTPKPSSSRSHSLPSLQTRPNSLSFTPKTITSGLKKHTSESLSVPRPPKESYIFDDAGVLSRVTKSDLKQLLSDLESRKNIKINFVTVRKLTSKADAFEYADQVLERWYPSIEEGKQQGNCCACDQSKGRGNYWGAGVSSKL
ncbi:hypothetical protein OIU84_006684 [Salix udensis]|uniref:TPM domain-containing protein n=1 Tax=Salix udensis TaxID=889485 RepID=A0AAD6JZX3_9ROSI|nr:hypothetical protein OIU84_006684 [Salix udensis]